MRAITRSFSGATQQDRHTYPGFSVLGTVEDGHILVWVQEAPECKRLSHVRDIDPAALADALADDYQAYLEGEDNWCARIVWAELCRRWGGMGGAGA